MAVASPRQLEFQREIFSIDAVRIFREILTESPYAQPHDPHGNEMDPARLRSRVGPRSRRNRRRADFSQGSGAEAGVFALGGGFAERRRAKARGHASFPGSFPHVRLAELVLGADGAPRCRGRRDEGGYLPRWPFDGIA